MPPFGLLRKLVMLVALLSQSSRQLSLCFKSLPYVSHFKPNHCPVLARLLVASGCGLSSFLIGQKSRQALCSSLTNRSLPTYAAKYPDRKRQGFLFAPPFASLAGASHGLNFRSQSLQPRLVLLAAGAVSSRSRCAVPCRI